MCRVTCDCLGSDSNQVGPSRPAQPLLWERYTTNTSTDLYNTTIEANFETRPVCMNLWKLWNQMPCGYISTLNQAVYAQWTLASCGQLKVIIPAQNPSRKKPSVKQMKLEKKTFLVLRQPVSCSRIYSKQRRVLHGLKDKRKKRSRKQTLPLHTKENRSYMFGRLVSVGSIQMRAI